MLYFVELYLYLYTSLYYYVNNFLYCFIFFLNNIKNNIFILLVILQITIGFLYSAFPYYKFLIFNNLSKVSKIGEINDTLIYGLTNIHPVFFYTCFILLVYNLTVKLNKIFYTKIKTVLYISFLAMSLGGFWGTGNSVWGFFWLSDPIEVILLLVSMLLLYINHVQLSQSNNFKITTVLLVIFLYLVIFRFGFILTRHNFFNINLLNNLFFFIICIYFTSYYLIFILYFLTAPFYYLIFFFYSTCLIYFSSNYIKNYTKINIAFHIFILSLLLIFLKHKENNISYFLYNTQLTYNNVFVFFNNYILTKCFFLKNKIILNIFFLNNFNVYISRSSIISFSYLSYWNYIALSLALISTLKIVPK